MNIADVTCADLSDGRTAGIHCWCNLQSHPVKTSSKNSIMIRKKEFKRNNYKSTLTCDTIQSMMKERVPRYLGWYLKLLNRWLFSVANYTFNDLIPYRKVESCPERERKSLNDKIRREFKRELGGSSDLEAVSRKFRQLDKNDDNRLTKNEIKTIFDLRWWLNILKRKIFDQFFCKLF